ncbi:hypothetical protein NQ317_000533 [Molorchus minor]|uniref:Uncharacterized protein n=1 Tax=Molorchus minor TaxID=1323400 RepID=A0ABQ9IVH2_9CUCU|nr:hypothetical protein NQ317_000533 [Molorchus minor]
MKDGKPMCYMDVYEVQSPADEERLRRAASMGIPNKTYLKYHQNKKKGDRAQAWLEYSTLAI